ncbi:MAG: DUF1294 domain-containing protein [Xanthomonadales bacterium]|nr:DUF1294 domain-containing protein [Xanthomonadales bacterium]
MRTTGKVTHWNTQKGYGFITPDSGDKNVFVHISSFTPRVEPPELDQAVSFEQSIDKRGRVCAEQVTLAGAENSHPFKRNATKSYYWAAALFLILLAAVAIGGMLPVPILFVYLLLSCLTYLVYFFDKKAAENDTRRMPEKTMHTLALLGGWPGAMIAQQLFRHKSRKNLFRVVFWMTVVLNVALLVWLMTASGASFLANLLN